MQSKYMFNVKCDKSRLITEKFVISWLIDWQQEGSEQYKVYLKFCRIVELSYAYYYISFPFPEMQKALDFRFVIYNHLHALLLAFSLITYFGYFDSAFQKERSSLSSVLPFTTQFTIFKSVPQNSMA